VVVVLVVVVSYLDCGSGLGSGSCTGRCSCIGSSSCIGSGSGSVGGGDGHGDNDSDRESSCSCDSTYQPAMSAIPISGGDGHAMDQRADGPTASRRDGWRRHRRNVVLNGRVDGVDAGLRFDQNC
jgi:hypothetical protein